MIINLIINLKHLVAYNPQFEKSRKNPPPQKWILSLLSVPPKILMPEQITIKAGKKLRVEAHVYGKPNPICKWKKGEDEVVTSSHLAIHKADSSSVLIIKDVTRKDSDYYSLTAENSSGTDTQKIKVTVMGRLPVRQVPIKI